MVAEIHKHLCAWEQNFEDKGKDTLMNSYGEMRVPPDQVISQSHPASIFMETSSSRTCVPMTML